MVGGAIGTDSIGIIVIIVSGYLGQINLEVYLSFNQKNTQVYQCYSVLASTFKKEVFLVQPFKFRLTLSRLSLTFWIEKVKGLQDSSVHIYIYIYIYNNFNFAKFKNTLFSRINDSD